MPTEGGVLGYGLTSISFEILKEESGISVWWNIFLSGRKRETHTHKKGKAKQDVHGLTRYLVVFLHRSNTAVKKEEEEEESLSGPI